MTKDIIGYEGIYSIDHTGSVFRNGKKLKPVLTCGYYQVNLSKDGKVKRYYIHRLVADAFINNEFGKRTVNHKNGVKTDNRVENLEWATQQENIIHSWAKGMSKPNTSNAKINRLHSEIIREASAHFKQRDIASYYKLSDAQVSKIVNNKQWKSCKP